MRRLSILLLSFLMLAEIHAQDLRNIMKIMGVTDAEELTQHELERFEDLYRRPVSVNTAGASELESSGLFSSFQIASLLDYRMRHGEIRSFTEMSLIDGFGQDWISAASPFLKIDDNAVEMGGTKVVSGTVSVRSGAKIYPDELRWNYGLKSQLSFKKIVDIGISASRPNDAAYYRPELYSGYVSCKLGTVNLIAGDFNARFGQGLCMWNASFSSSLSSPSSFMKRPSGISAASSFTGTAALTGLAGVCSLGKWRLSVLAALPELKSEGMEHLDVMPCLNVTRYGKYGHASLTHIMEFDDLKTAAFRIPQMKTSADASVCIRGVNIYGEAMADWVERKVSAVAGVNFPCGEYMRMASRLHYIPVNNDCGLAFGGEVMKGRHEASMTVDVSYYPDGKSGADGQCVQGKTIVLWVWRMTEKMMLKLRLSERMRTWGESFRTDVRADVLYDDDRWLAAARLNLLQCMDIGILGYAEVGYRRGGMSVYMRCGMYRIENWDDRIYVYERDAPGSFNVPAYYGRGIWVSSYMCWKLVDRLTMYFRAALKKPGNAELKCMLTVRF